MYLCLLLAPYSHHTMIIDRDGPINTTSLSKRGRKDELKEMCSSFGGGGRMDSIYLSSMCT